MDWNLSLDYIAGECEDGDLDKSSVLSGASYAPFETALAVRDIHRVTIHTSLILSCLFDSHNCLLCWPGGNESRIPGTDL